MKNAKLILFTAIATIATFTMVFYSSCSNPCKNVVCQNGGACDRGGCICPTGYSGKRCQILAITEIDYVNYTYTPVHITVNGSTSVIPVGGTLAITGEYGSDGSASVEFYGDYGSDLVNNLDNSFPASGVLSVPIDCGPNYFFVEVTNTSGYRVTQLQVNNRVEPVNIPSDGNTYGIGYFLMYSNNVIYSTLSSGGYYTTYPVLTGGSTDPLASINLQ